MQTNSSERDPLASALADVRAVTDLVPRVALVLGSGLGAFADSLENRTVLPYRSLSGMFAPEVEGHAGNLVLGEVEGVPTVAMQGRVHLYEGHEPSRVVFGVRLMIALGARVLICTNAAGGIADRLPVGALMAIEDHLNLTGKSPLVGPRSELLGRRFVDMTTAYDRALRRLAEEAAQELGFALGSGIYAGMLGPQYETPAEIRMLRTLGADAVGMSTVLEVIAARQLDARVLGISCITNHAAGLGDSELRHEEVEATASDVQPRFEALLRSVIRRLPNEVTER